jgi:cytochrome c oxidase subunit 1
MATIAQPTTLVTPVTKPASGLWSWITTVDHKRIGLLYSVTALFFFLTGGLEAMIIRLQLIRPNNDVVSAAHYNELFTMHGTTMIFLAIMPLSVGIANYIVPLQIGARDVAFPRLNAFSYWTFLAGGVILNMSWFFDKAPNQGWYGYAPLSDLTWNPTRNVDFWMFGLQVLGVASIAGGINFVTTIINLRAPGMTMMRMPIFTWATFITQIMIVMAMPAVTIALILLSFDRYAGTGFFAYAAGGDPLLWQHLFWVFGHPEVYILVLPAFGIVSEIIPVFSRKPLFGYSVMVYALAAIAFLGFSVWAHHMFTTGLGPTANSAFAGATMLIAIPTGVKIFNWLGTMFRGSLKFTTPMLFAVGLVSQFTIGGLSGVMHASPPVDTQHNDTYFVIAHFHYVLFGGSIFGLLGATYYWFPKMSGKMMDEKLGKINFWTTFIGFNATFFPMHFLGLAGMPRRYYTYGEGSGWGFWNLIVSCGAFFLGASILLFVYNLGRSIVKGEPAGPNPWDAATAEWMIPSPPPAYNFAVTPLIHHRDPIWWDKYGASDPHIAESPEYVADADHLRELEINESGIAPGPVHLPNPSYYPVLSAIGFFIGVLGLLIDNPHITIGLVHLPILCIIGTVIMVSALYGWAFEPASDPVPAGAAH